MSGTVDPLVLLPVLAAAGLHATWNALAHAIPDRLTAFTLMAGVYVVGGVGLVVWSAGPAMASWMFLAASAALHVGYNLLLMASYRLGEFGQVYPLARGTGVAVVALSATLLLAVPMSARQGAGVGLVCVGLCVLTATGGPSRARQPLAVAAAVATGMVIAAYTVVDGLGVRRAGTVSGYTGWLFLLQGPVLPVLATSIRGRALLPSLRRHLATGLAGGLLSVLAYGLVLWAQTRGSLPMIAALRESSVLMGAVIGSLVFKEPFGRTRILAASLVTAGVAIASA